MNDKVTREGAVQGTGALDASRERLFTQVVPASTKKAEEVKLAPVTAGPVAFEPKMTKAVAEQKGFFKAAKPMGWGIYSVQDLDGGQGSIWHLEKGADGQDYITKTVDGAGEVVRRVKATQAK